MVEARVVLSDGTRIRSWTSGSHHPDRVPVVMLHGGPGLPDYLEPVAAMIVDSCLVHRYDQRGTGGSPWKGDHSIAGQVDDLAQLLDAWGHDRVVLAGHSYGTNLACYFLLAHPERVAGMILLAGPYLGSWRDAVHARERARRSDEQQARLDQLAAVDTRTEVEEVEFLTLSWFTDHADQDRAWTWASVAARSRRPVNYLMNTQLNSDKRAQPLEQRVDDLRKLMPPGAEVIAGAGDPRPEQILREVGPLIGCAITIIPGAGHEPWREAPDQFSAQLRTAVRTQTPRVD